MSKKKAIRVQAVKSFVSIIGDKKYRVEQDQKLELPEGADWLEVGFVVPVREEQVETATVKPAEKAVTRTKKAVDKVMRRTSKK
jgi:hypothetical protein